MHTLFPIMTSSRLSIHAFSPSHTSFPYVSFQGNFMFTLFFITSPFPIFAPKSFRKNTFIPIKGFQEARTNNALTKYQRVCFINPAPLLKFPVLKEDKRTSVIALIFFYIDLPYHRPFFAMNIFLLLIFFHFSPFVRVVFLFVVKNLSML